MKPPSNIKEVTRFLGMAGFYRKHIEKFSNIASPLTNLTRKNKRFEWTTECQNAFTTLKQKLNTAPILTKASINKPFVLETDASQHHVAAVLMQCTDNNLPQVVAYFFKKLRPVEIRYSATDREALAIVLSCRQFNSYLWGTKFVIRTDHQPVVSVFKHKTKLPRTNRWILEMRDYLYKTEYKQGRKNVVADHLSRPVRIINSG